MNKTDILKYLSAIDSYMEEKATITVYGSAAFILLDEEARTSLDIDVAGPYSSVDYHAFCRAVEKAGLFVNPEAGDTDHVEWISPVRLCLAKPETQTQMLLWQGRKLLVITVAPADLVASKLIRYDAIDASDVRYLVTQMKITAKEVMQAVDRLPQNFKDDILVHENLRNLFEDMELWKSQI